MPAVLFLHWVVLEDGTITGQRLPNGQAGRIAHQRIVSQSCLQYWSALARRLYSQCPRRGVDVNHIGRHERAIDRVPQRDAAKRLKRFRPLLKIWLWRDLTATGAASRKKRRAEIMHVYPCSSTVVKHHFAQW